MTDYGVRVALPNVPTCLLTYTLHIFTELYKIIIFTVFLNSFDFSNTIQSAVTLQIIDMQIW